ncbi:hypothetical protein [Natronorubrum sulfidifaciens]|uniref:hypothetical protein n=1 Tax=Natronorubrum sulfidifaciens TaxID=388259 RepID=UPI001267610C|nr:hypothetical protein [Natronorubrum sulfidifaciens]
MSQKEHTKKNGNCPNCGESGHQNWEKNEVLPQIEWTYICQNCGNEAYLYDNSEPPQLGQSFVWVPVSHHMRTVLQFQDITSTQPDQILSDYYRQGLERSEAIDYYIVEDEGTTQTEWAERTNRNQSTVSENVSKARGKLK